MEKSQEVKSLESIKDHYIALKQELSKVIVGQTKVIDDLILAIFCKGHVLLEGVPGLAKTLLVKKISDILGLKFSRIQFTPDLMPSDILGTEVLDENKNFKFLKGPIFSNIILADEINRTPPKTQAALLEAMQEKSVTIAGVNNKLDIPFFVLATQNPIEQEGTYPLPEAQLDRFLFNIKVDYPSFKEEIDIVKNTNVFSSKKLNLILNSAKIIEIQDLIEKIPVADNVIEYAVKLVSSTRPNQKFSKKQTNDYISWGAGPRASQYLIHAAKARSVVNGKFSPDIIDVKSVALSVLRHRLIFNYKAEAEKITIEKFLNSIF